MRELFVATGALVALGNKQDGSRAQGRQLTLAECRFVTTDAVLLEVGNTFSRAPFKPVALRLIETAWRAPRWRCIPVDRARLDRGVTLFRQRSDKDWSLT